MVVKRACEICGIEFYTDNYEIKRGGGRFCSYACAGKAIRGKNHPNFGKSLTKEHKRKISESLRGNRNPNFGKAFSAETIHKMSIAKKGKYCGKLSPCWRPKVKCVCKTCGCRFESRESVVKSGGGLYCSRDCYYAMKSKDLKAREHMNKIRKKQAHTKTNPELLFEEICKRNNLPFYYVGNQRLLIGNAGETKLNPDFIEANGKKVCIEIFGDYWHSPLLNRDMPRTGNLDFRKRHYKMFGWQSIFIWETDIKRVDAEQYVLSLLKKEKCIYV